MNTTVDSGFFHLDFGQKKFSTMFGVFYFGFFFRNDRNLLLSNSIEKLWFSIDWPTETLKTNSIADSGWNCSEFGWKKFNFGNGRNFLPLVPIGNLHFSIDRPRRLGPGFGILVLFFGFGILVLFFDLKRRDKYSLHFH